MVRNRLMALVAAVMGFTLVACGGGASTSTGVPQTSTPTTATVASVISPTPLVAALTNVATPTLFSPPSTATAAAPPAQDTPVPASPTPLVPTPTALTPATTAVPPASSSPVQALSSPTPIATARTPTQNAFVTAWQTKSLRYSQYGDTISYQQVWNIYIKAWSEAIDYFNRADQDSTLLQNPTFLRSADASSNQLRQVGDELHKVVASESYPGTLPASPPGVSLKVSDVVGNGGSTGQVMGDLYSKFTAFETTGQTPTMMAYIRQRINQDKQRHVELAQLIAPFCPGCVTAALPGPTTSSAGATSRNNKYKAPPPLTIDKAKKYTATIVTNMGTMKIELFADTAPTTVNNFVFLANDHFYDGLSFHRVVAGFVIQGGDPTGTGTGGPGYKFADEPVPATRNYEKGTLAMANSGPNTNGSQFFFCADNLSAKGTLPRQYTIFGKVSEGLDVLDNILAVPRTAGGDGAQSKPTAPILMQTVSIQVA